MRIFARITAQYRPKPFISGAIENKLEKSASILHVFEPSATKLQRPRVSPATSLL